MINFDYTIFVQFGNFIVLLILLNFFLFRPILGTLKKRKNALSALTARVDQLRGEAVALGKTYDESAKEKRRPILEQRESALKEAHASSMKVIEEARNQLTVELEQIKGTVRKEADEALKSLTAKTGQLAAEVVAKVMKRGA